LCCVRAGAAYAPGGLPATTAAVALRLFALDGATLYAPGLAPALRDVSELYLYSQPAVPVPGVAVRFPG
jgi:hypothetical protein